jgi:uncharacterized cupredoxin-like copper-binding protein
MTIMPKDPVRERAEVRFHRSGTPGPPEPPRSRLPVIAVVAVVAIAIAIGAGIVLIARGGNGSASRAAPPTTTTRARGTGTTPTPTAPGAKIAITLKEFTVSSQPAVGRAGRVTFRVHNGGKVKHELVVLRTTKPAAALKKGSEASEAGNVGEIGGLRPGASKTLKLTLKPGHYALVCNLPGHYLAGQFADFTVR